MINRVILLGNVGKDPEVRYLEGGLAVAKFSLATSETWKDKSGEKHTSTEWHNIVAWKGLAELTEKYLIKGQMLYVEGKLETKSYEKDGRTIYTTQIKADNFKMIGKKPGGTQVADSETKAELPQNAPESYIDDPGDGLPF